MINELLHDIYVSNLAMIVIAIPIILVVWSIIGAIFSKYMRIICAVVAVASVFVILYATVFSRNEATIGAELLPLSSFERAQEQPEMYRSMLMNVFLFFPLGMSLIFVFSGRSVKRFLMTILIGFILSATVEAIQYFCSLGMAETDDVICNTLGTFIGSCAYPLSLFWKRILCRKIEKTND